LLKVDDPLPKRGEWEAWMCESGRDLFFPSTDLFPYFRVFRGPPPVGRGCRHDPWWVLDVGPSLPLGLKKKSGSNPATPPPQAAPISAIVSYFSLIAPIWIPRIPPIVMKISSNHMFSTIHSLPYLTRVVGLLSKVGLPPLFTRRFGWSQLPQGGGDLEVVVGF